MVEQNETSNPTKAQRKQERRLAKQQEREQETKKQKRKRAGIWGGAAVVVVIIIVGIIFSGGGDNNQGGDSAALSLAAVPDDWVKGNAAAVVELVEYGDFQCPACAQFQPIVKQVEEEVGDKVKIVYRHFPFSSHQHARPPPKRPVSRGSFGRCTICYITGRENGLP
jgi:protein-disulfide isomerase